jgi:hypothetical protein
MDGHDPPTVARAGAVDPVDAGDRAILDREGERGLGIAPLAEAGHARYMPAACYIVNYQTVYHP